MELRGCHTLATRQKRAKLLRRRMASLAVAARARALGAAGNSRRGFGGASVWRTEPPPRLVHPGGNLLDLAGGLFSAIHATGGACVSSQHGPTRSDAGESARFVGGGGVGTVCGGDAASRLAGRGGGHAAGICDRVGRICGFSAGVCSRESTHLDRDSI